MTTHTSSHYHTILYLANLPAPLPPCGHIVAFTAKEITITWTITWVYTTKHPTKTASVDTLTSDGSGEVIGLGASLGIMLLLAVILGTLITGIIIRRYRQGKLYLVPGSMVE